MTIIGGAQTTLRIGAILVAAGFADYPLIAFHFTRADTVSSDWIAIFYAVAMAVSGMGSLLLGRLFDRYGFAVLIRTGVYPIELVTPFRASCFASAARTGDT